MSVTKKTTLKDVQVTKTETIEVTEYIATLSEKQAIALSALLGAVAYDELNTTGLNKLFVGLASAGIDGYPIYNVTPTVITIKKVALW